MSSEGPLDGFFAPLAAKTGLGVDVVKLLFCLLASFAFSSYHKFAL